MVGIAQLVSAPDCGSGGPGFESLYPPVIPWEAVPGAFLYFTKVRFEGRSGRVRGCGGTLSGKHFEDDSGNRK